ncbi:MAG: hypothetical protein CTY18_12010 [Methylomonas sp.]|nr:MAG: hypothetical protein CTY18_12010 [Methylomonas sp.]
MRGKRPLPKAAAYLVLKTALYGLIKGNMVLAKPIEVQLLKPKPHFKFFRCPTVGLLKIIHDL